MKTKHTNPQHLFFLSIILCLSSMFSSLKTYAQHEDLFDETWYLEKLTIENDTIYNPTRGDLNYDIASTIYFNSENNGIIDFGGCPGEYNFIEMEFDEIDNFFNTSGIGGFPLQFCSDFWGHFEGLEEFTDLYFNDFFYGYGTEGDILIYYNIHQNNNSSQTLILTNPDNYKAYYNSVFLSTPDFEILNSSIYPNPVQDQLFIRLEDISTVVNIKIYDLQGRVIKNFETDQKETPLDVSNYHPGMYFIKLTNSSNQQKTMKFIKQ